MEYPNFDLYYIDIKYMRDIEVRQIIVKSQIVISRNSYFYGPQIRVDW